MKEVRVDHHIEAPPDEVLDELSPEVIIGCVGTYEIDSTEMADEKTVVEAGNEDLAISLEFREHEWGYEYNQREDVGPFETMETTLSVQEGERRGGARVSIHSEFTFGSIWSVILDYLGARVRKQELRRLVRNLESTVVSAEER